MDKHGKIACLILAIFFCTIALGSVMPSAHAACQDISGHWAQTQIEFMMEKQIITGYGDSTFKPDQPITRAEFMVMTNKSFGFTGSTSINYSDVKSSDWFFADIVRAGAAGYISGYEDGTMRPDQHISRQEVAVIIARILSLKPSDSTLTLDNLSDHQDIASWSRDSVAANLERDYLQGYPDKSFKPAKSITRAEAATILKNVYAKRPENVYTQPAQTGKILSQINNAGIYGPASGTQEIAEDITITASGVKLRNAVVNGDLTVSETVGDGEVEFNHVSFQGTTYIKGGGANSIKFNQCRLNKVVVNKLDDNIRIVLSEDSSISTLVVDSGLKLIGKGIISNLNINSSGVEIEPVPVNTPVIKNGITAIVSGEELAGSSTTTSTGGGGGGGGAPSTPQAATPVATPAAGEVAAGTEIALTSATNDANIYYTTNGAVPTSASTLYNSDDKPVINSSQTIKAIAIKANYLNSAVLTAAYTIPLPSTASISLTDPSTLSEAAANDGTLANGTITVTITNGTLAADISKADVTTNNLPAGMDYTVSRTSDTVLTITITGAATNHSNANDVANLTFTIAQAKVIGATSDLTTSNISIAFNNPPWTIMVYVDADNNLEPQLLEDIAEMKAGTTDEINLVVLIDRINDYSSDSSVLGENFTDTRLYAITPETATRIAGSTQFPEITTTSNYEANMGDASTLKKFIAFCKANYTAEHYALILANHGGGTRARAETPSPSHNNNERAVCWDDTDSSDCLYIAEISDVLDSDDSVNLLGFDACFMATAEVAYQYRPGNDSFEADVMVASGPSEWIYGWKYEQLLARLQSGGGNNGETDSTMGSDELYYDPASMTALELGGVIVEEQHDSCEGSVSDQALACFDLTQVAGVKSAVDTLAVQVVTSNEKVDFEAIRGTLNASVTMEYFDQNSIDEWYAYPYFDLYDLCSRASSSADLEDAVKDAASSVISAVDDMVIYSYGGSNYAGFQNSKNGISIFFPDGALLVNDNTPDPNDYLWDFQWWYNSIDTAAWWDADHLYGKLKWCLDDQNTSADTVGNWFEMLDSWYETGGNAADGGYNGFQW